MGGAASGLYKTIIIMFIESFALYAGFFVLFLGLWSSPGNYAQDTIFQILIQVQVRAILYFSTHQNLGNTLSDDLEQVISPLLIVLRVANRSALTGDGITSGIACSIQFNNSQGESTDGEEGILDGNTTSVRATNGGFLGEVDAGAENITGEVPLW